MLVCLLLLLFNSDKNKFTIILQIDSMCFQKISIAVVKTDSYSTFRCIASLRCILTSAWASTAEGSFLWIIVP